MVSITVVTLRRYCQRPRNVHSSIVAWWNDENICESWLRPSIKLFHTVPTPPIIPLYLRYPNDTPQPLRHDNHRCIHQSSHRKNISNSNSHPNISGGGTVVDASRTVVGADANDDRSNTNIDQNGKSSNIHNLLRRRRQPSQLSPIAKTKTTRSPPTMNTVVRNIQALCREEVYPIGSMTTGPAAHLTMLKVKGILDVFAAASLSYGNNDQGGSRNNNSNSSSVDDDDDDEQHDMMKECINAIMQLLVRISREPSDDNTSQLTAPPVHYYNSILTKWNHAVIVTTQQQQQQQQQKRDCHDNYDDVATLYSATLVAQLLIDHGISEIPLASSSPTTSQSVSSSSPAFRFIKYNTYTVSLILQAALHQTPSTFAPKVLESIWNEFHLDQSVVENDTSIIYCYNMLLQSYIQCGHVDSAVTKMESLWEELQTRNIQPNMATYHLRLKYYREQHRLLELENFINSVQRQTRPTSRAVGTATTNRPSKNESLQPQPHLPVLSLSCWYEVLQSYMDAAKKKHSIETNNSLFYLHKGQTIFQQTMIPQVLRYTNAGTTTTDTAEIAKAMQLIITTYRRILQQPQYNFDIPRPSNPKSNPQPLSDQQRIINNNPMASKQQYARDRIFESAESFYQYMQRQPLTDVRYRVLHSTMMDIYANAGRLDKVLEIFQKHFLQQHDIVQYSILMKAYGNSDLANMSEQVLVELLTESYDIDMNRVELLFHTLINAWEISSAPNATQRAYRVLQMMKDRPKCIQNNIRPTVMTYSFLLKCLETKSLSHTNTNEIKYGICRIVEKIVPEMELTFGFDDENRNDSVVVPILTLYNAAIKILVRLQDYEQAESMLHALETSDTMSASNELYTELVHICTIAATSTTAIQGEKFLSHMVQLSKKQQRPSLLPDERLCLNVIDAWIASNDIDACRRIWDIYVNHLCNSINFELSERTYDTIIPYLATVSTGNYVDKADEILQRMEVEYTNALKESGPGNTTATASQAPYPNSHHYIPVLHGYIWAGDMDNASNILLRQVNMCVDEVDPIRKRAMSPNQRVYLGVATGWIEIGQTEQASLIIETIQELYDEGKLVDGPCRNAYYTLLNAYLPQHHLSRRGYYINKYKRILNEMKKVKKISVDGITTSVGQSAERMLSQSADTGEHDDDDDEENW